MWRITALILCLALNSQVSAEIIEIHSLDEMDDQRGFCIDVRGHKSKAKINSGLQAHTCYSYQGSIAVDQGFDSLESQNPDQRQYCLGKSNRYVLEVLN